METCSSLIGRGKGTLSPLNTSSTEVSESHYIPIWLHARLPHLVWIAAYIYISWYKILFPNHSYFKCRCKIHIQRNISLMIPESSEAKGSEMNCCPTSAHVIYSVDCVIQVESKSIWSSEHKRGPPRGCWELHMSGNQWSWDLISVCVTDVCR